MKSPRKDKTGIKAKKPPGHNSGIDPEQQKLFLNHKTLYERASDKFKKAQGEIRKLGQSIKADGFSLRQIKLAIELDDPEGEAVLRMAIANDLLVARWMSCDVGQQMDMFMEPSRVPSSDRAYSEGQRASMENRAAMPKYDPSTEQHARYMAGFHDHQEGLVKAGIGKLEDNKGPANGKAKPAKAARGRPKAAAKVAKPAAGKPRGRPSNASKAASAGAEPITRAALAATKDAEPDSYFSRSAKTSGNA